MVSPLLIERVREDNRERHTLPLDILEQRIDACNNCVHCQYNHCQRIGCSVWRFRECLLSKEPLCPLNLHKGIPGEIPQS